MIDKTMTIYEVLSKDPNSAAVMMAYGMGCIGCPHAANTGNQWLCRCASHGVDADELVAKLNEYFAEKQAQ